MSVYDNFNTASRSQLEQLSTEQLDEIMEASLEPDSRVDEDTVLRILEVLQEREGKAPTPSLDAAFENILQEHLPSKEQRAEAKHETDIENGQSIKPKTKQRTLLPRILSIAAAAAIVIFAAGSLIPTASGSNLWSAFIEWTKETFGYSTKNSVLQNEVPEQLQELFDMMEDYGVPTAKLLPSYITKGYETTTTLCDERENATIFFCMLENGENSIILQYRLLKTGEATTEYQKNDSEIEKYTSKVSKDIFFIVANLNLYTATWSDGNMECSIQNVPSHDELIKMIDSIYEGN